jgi:predicted amidohydrolase
MRLMKETVRVAALQWQHRDFASAAEFWTELAWQIRIAREDYAAELLVLPEYVGAGLPGAWPAEDEWREKLLACSQQHQMWIIVGSFPVRDADGLRNRSLVLGPQGESYVQDKLHITPWERNVWQMSGGSSWVAIDVGACKIAVAICYDVEFPEQIRALAEEGVEVLFVPYCTDDAHGHHRVTRCALARAVENTMFVVTAGGVGLIRHRAGFAHHFAESVIATPCDVGFPADGILARALPGQAQCLVVDLNLSLLRHKRAHGTVLPLRDLRRDLFFSKR